MIDRTSGNCLILDRSSLFFIALNMIWIHGFQLPQFMTRWLLATALDHIPQGYRISIGQSERGWEERVIRYQEKREGIAEIGSKY